MKKFQYLIAFTNILILVFVTSFFSIDNFSKKEEFIFQIRYELITNIENFTYPKKLPKNNYKNYWHEFQNVNSNLSWFEPIKINLKQDKIVLDIKDQYIQKINYLDIKMSDILVFNLSSSDSIELFLIIDQAKPSSVIESEVKAFCESKNEQFLFEKGLSKLITF
ncbi:unknown transmembrane protein [Mesoplasma florum W37]|uniref:Uncharacterized protein n=1 Tax=Mesoplasma florum TaxID=2151 RepID=A0AAD0MP10_MESFO|nr:hypothetical protein [Mesoplasma florum]AGY41459.1 unknown transmembrane protein [Mesoplasma florum W37]AVN59676.1 hypothetical protein CG008_02040 [Mesoplasma florum]AVN65799.1 hypothetical protein MflW12_3940 [Mesoplasma florum]